MPGIITGEPGERWLNDTGIVLWQFECSLVNTCGQCLVYHMAIGPHWGIPLHRCCRCRQTPLSPGEYGLPFIDFRQVVRDMDESQHAAAVGKSNWKLINRGIVEWNDVVTPQRVLTFHEVVANSDLTFKQLVKAGIARHLATSAIADGNSSEIPNSSIPNYPETPDGSTGGFNWLVLAAALEARRQAKKKREREKAIK